MVGVSCQIAKLLAADDFGKKLRTIACQKQFVRWKASVRLVQSLAKSSTRSKISLQLFVALWNGLLQVAKKRQHWHDYVPIAFHRWLFVRKLRLRLGLKLRGRESPHFRIRREWRLWVRKSVNWLILGIATLKYIAKLDRELAEKLRKRPLKNLMPSGFTLSQLD